MRSQALPFTRQRPRVIPPCAIDPLELPLDSANLKAMSTYRTHCLDASRVPSEYADSKTNTQTIKDKTIMISVPSPTSMGLETVIFPESNQALGLV